MPHFADLRSPGVGAAELTQGVAGADLFERHIPAIDFGARLFGLAVDVHGPKNFARCVSGSFTPNGGRKPGELVYRLLETVACENANRTYVICICEMHRYYKNVVLIS